MDKYTFLLAEKKEAAERISKALDSEGKPKRAEENGVTYFEANRSGEKIIVAPALGHLYTVAPENEGRFFYPVFNVKWVPKHLVERDAKRTQTWINVISKLATRASNFVLGTDYDIEGEVIGYTILKYACRNKEDQAKRMKFSTLTREELTKAYEGLSPHMDFLLAKAGETRHVIDFLWGVNLSRALTLAAKNWSKKYATLSTGRVQGPTLRFLVEREKDIQTFVPNPFWSIRAKAEIDGKIYEAKYEKDAIERKEEADAVVKECSEKEGITEKIDVRKFIQKPPVPFDLGALQTEAYGLFGFTPIRTLSIAERLYLDALISYPRTSSQKIPPAINYRKILASLSKDSKYSQLAAELLAKEKLKPQEGKKEDPAHPAVYPTGNLPERSLNASEKKVFDLIVRRFMALFGESALKQGMKVTINVNDHRFYIYGRRILKGGWLKFYGPYTRSDEVILPPLTTGEKILLKEVVCEDKFTHPSPRYNPSSLLKLMEKEKIGTKATRADIIDTLYNRGYTRGERILVTELGFDVTEILKEYCPRIISVKFTRELEEKMTQIEAGEQGQEAVLEEVISRLKPILEELKAKEAEVGRDLSVAIRNARLQERIIGPCPHCGTGELIILYSRKTGKRFAGCTNYRRGKCTTSFPLPQRPYVVKPARKNCRLCQWPMVGVKGRGRRPWNLCLNPDCPSKEELRKRRDAVRNL